MKSGANSARIAMAAFAVLVAGMFAIGASATAQTATVETVSVSSTGPETNLPLPRYVSLKSSKANIRRGPGLTHRIDWVFLRRGMPLEVIAEHGHWRKVRDADNATGWVHHALLRGARSAIVTAEQAVLRRKPDAGAPQVAHAEPGVIFRVERCVAEWCEVRKDRFEGWVRKAEIWGAHPSEVFD